MITVGIADMKVAKSDDTLVTYALGSCVGICLFDPVLKIGGLGHIMLPSITETKTPSNEQRYADSCIPVMLREMEKLGCRKVRLTAKIAGGAKMFNIDGVRAFDIGQRNIASVKKVLQDLGIRIVAEDTGLNYGRTVYFYTDSGQMLVKSFACGTKAY